MKDLPVLPPDSEIWENQERSGKLRGAGGSVPLQAPLPPTGGQQELPDPGGAVRGWALGVRDRRLRSHLLERGKDPSPIPAGENPA